MFGHAKTTKKASKIIESIWYANILSGASTHNRNVFANFTQWIGEMTVQSVKSMAQGDFITPIKMLGGSLRGLKRGLTAAVYTQMTGTRLDRLDKTEMLPVFEWWRYDTGNKFVDKVLNYSPWGPEILKHVGRLLSAGDALFYHAGYEMKASQMASKIAKDNRRSNPKQQDYETVNQILYNDSESGARADKMARSEGFSPSGSIRNKLEYSIRVKELMEQERGKEFSEASDNFAARMTFNYEPEGTMGGFYRGWMGMANEHPIMKLFIPFAKIITNVTNRYADWTPYGLYRAARGDTKIKNGRRKLTSDERADIVIKSMIGLTTAIGLGLLSNGDKRLFDITGGMTNSLDKNYQIQESGERPYSIHLIGTDKWYSYIDTPLFFMLAGVGSINDAKKWGDKDPLSSGRMLEIAGMGMMASMSESSWMMGVSSLMKSIDPKRLKSGNKEVAIKTFDAFFQGAQSLAVGNWATQASRLWLEMNHDPIKRAQGFEKFYRDIPYVKNSLDNIITAFGNKVVPTTSEKMFFPFASGTDSDPIAKLYTDNNVFVPRPQQFDVLDPDTLKTRTATDDEMYQFAAVRGMLIKKITNDYMDMINQYNPQQREKVLKKIVSKATSVAKAIIGVNKNDRQRYIDTLFPGKYKALFENLFTDTKAEEQPVGE